MTAPDVPVGALHPIFADILDPRDMNAPATFPARDAAQPQSAKPTLEQALRFVDLSFECGAEAHRLIPAERREEGRNLEREALCARLRLEAMEREGLPLSLLGDGKTANQRHFEHMNREHGVPLPWEPVPLSSFADIGEGARHPLQNTTDLGVAA